MIDFIQKKYAGYVVRPYLQWYLKKPRLYKYADLCLKIYPTVFHPKYFFSTQFFISYLQKLDLNGKTFCEVGAGSALVSFLTVTKGAKALALELNEKAVQGIRENIQTNKIPDQKIRVVHSDLFDSVDPQKFDVIFINPPYFFKEVSDGSSTAWNCGLNGEYFSKLFNQLKDFTHSETDIYMTLAANCDVTRIKEIGERYGFLLDCICESKIKWEKNFIFKVNFK